MCVKFGSGAADCARIGIDEASARQASVEAAMIGFIRLLFDSTDCVFDRRSADSVRGSITARGTNVASTELTMSPLWCGGRLAERRQCECQQASGDYLRVRARLSGLFVDAARGVSGARRFR